MFSAKMNLNNAKEPVCEPIILADKSLMKKAVRVLVSAYRDNPLLHYIVPDDASDSLLNWFIGTGVRYGMQYGEVYTTTEVNGAAIWFTPDHPAVTVWGMFRSGMFLTPFRLGAHAFNRLTDYMSHIARIRRATVPQPHWYLCELGVDPERQGKGIGSALIRPVLDRADTECLPCYCETCTERAVAFYGKHGFRVAHVVDVPIGGPRFWALKREPR